MTTRERNLTCPKCAKSHHRLTRRCNSCGLELLSKDEFYPALWSYGCPRHGDCREPLIFRNDKMRCPLHGGVYRICEEVFDEPINLRDTVIYSRGEHALEHVEWEIEGRIGNYTVTSCPECAPEGPVGDYSFSLYERNDAEGRTLSALCRACGSTEHRNWFDDVSVCREEADGHKGKSTLTSQDDIKTAWRSKRGSSLSVVIDNAIDKAVEWTSTAEDSLRSAAIRESAIPRWAQVLSGALCAPLSLLLGIGALGFGAEILLEGARDLPSLVALATLFTLSVFFATVSYRLLLGQRRGSYGSLLSPTFMIGFGILMSAAGIWGLIDGTGDLAFLLFGLAAVSAGLTLRQRARVTKKDES